MLLQLLDFIKKTTYVSGSQLAREFRIDLSALQPMLDFWIKKGMIKSSQEKISCEKRCIQCKSPEIIYIMCV